MDIVLLHGSVETSTEEPYLSGLEKAAMFSCRCLASNGSVLDAAEAAVRELESNPLFNAGYGSVANLSGKVEMDASIMDGCTGQCGAVAAIPDVEHPVSVARRVMEDTPHVILAGQGALQFARQKGIPPFNPLSELQRINWKRAIANKLASSEEMDRYSLFTGLPKACDTVGSVIYADGRLAAASSTGGSFLKLPGRIGDTPIIGGGIYATKDAAVVCTGLGEGFIRLHGASAVVDQIAQGVAVNIAASNIIQKLTQQGIVGGMLVVDSKGNYAAVHNSDSFPVVVMVNGKKIVDFIPTNNFC
jgi:L-asparaginase / beta-aspartyl-peptidase